MEGMATKEAFYEEWLNQIRKGFGHMRAYENAEIRHFNQYGRYRYSDYRSFKSSNK